MSSFKGKKMLWFPLWSWGLRLHCKWLEERVGSLLSIDICEVCPLVCSGCRDWAFPEKLLDQLLHLSGWAISHCPLLYSIALLLYSISIDTVLRYFCWVFIPYASGCLTLSCHPAAAHASSVKDAKSMDWSSLGFQCWLITRGMSQGARCDVHGKSKCHRQSEGWAMPQLSVKLWFSISGLPQW